MSMPAGAFPRAAVGLVAGAAGGLLLTWLRVPAGTLVGAVLGSAAAGHAVNAQPHPLQRRVRTAGLVLIGCVSAARLDGESLKTLGLVALPVLTGVVLLLALNAALARWLMKRHQLDPVTAVLACAPGGLSELSVLAVDKGADVGTVTVIHLLRVLLVVLVALPGLVLLLSRLP